MVPSEFRALHDRLRGVQFHSGTGLQEQHGSCEELLALAENGRISLALPSFSVPEARLSLTRRAKRRRKFHVRLKKELRELSRSQPYHELSSRTEPLTSALIESGEADSNRLEAILARLLTISQILPLHHSTARKAMEVEASFKLSPSDAVIFASIIEDLAKKPEGPKCFLNRNSKDFANPDIYDELAKFACKLLPSFKDGVGYILGTISK